jgi:hypothetical protein
MVNIISKSISSLMIFVGYRISRRRIQWKYLSKIY